MSEITLWTKVNWVTNLENEKEIHEIVTKNYLREKNIPFVKRERVPVQASAIAPPEAAPVGAPPQPSAP